MINVVYEKKDDLTVLYDSNNGTGDIYVDEKNPYIYEEEVTVLPNMFTAPEGHHFVGWKVEIGEYYDLMPMSVDGNTDEVKDIEPGDILQPDEVFRMPAYDVTLVAQWVKTHTVTFKAGNGGSLTGQTVFADILDGTTWGAAEITVPTPVANSGYYFSGWAPSLPGNDYLITEDLEFIANFTRRSRRDDDDDDDDDRGGGTSKPTPVVVEIPDEEIPAGLPQLNKEDHFQYIQGYPDGTVKP
ncbi:MAG: InlB B-repeat-containing protein, partial [Lutispora sp.]